jgi:hypothetical protein
LAIGGVLVLVLVEKVSATPRNAEAEITGLPAMSTPAARA